MDTSGAWTRRLRFGACLLGVLIASTSQVSGQDVRASLIAGVSEFDLSGTGDAFTAGARVDVPVHRLLLFEGGVNVMFIEQQFGDTTTVVLPDAQIQVQLPRRLAPYFGVGVGLAADFREEVDGGTQVDVTFSVAGGVRFDVAEALGLRAELRVRGHETGFVGTTADLTAGLSWRF